MAQQTFIQESSQRFSRIKDLRYFFRLGIALGAKALRDRIPTKDEDAQRTKDIAADLGMYGLMAVTTELNLREIKDKTTNVFRPVIAKELNIPPEQVNYRHLRKSKNLIVRRAYQDVNRFIWMSHLTDFTFGLGGILPLAENIIRKLRGKPAPTQTDEETGKTDKRYSIASGWGMDLGVASTSLFYLTELFQKETGSFMHTEQLARKMDSDSPPDKKGLAREIPPALIQDLYNQFVDEFYKQHPEKRSAAGIPEPQRPWWRRMTDTVGSWFRFGQEKQENPLIFLPKRITETDVRTKGVFTFMAELLTRSSVYEHRSQGSNMNFQFEDLVQLLSRGWVNVDYPEITQYAARIVGLEGSGALNTLDRKIAALTMQNGGLPPGPADIEKAMRTLYKETVAKELAKEPTIASHIKVHVVENGTELSSYNINAQAVAEAIGPERLRHYLGLTAPIYKDDAPPIPLKQDSEGRIVEATMNYHQWTRALQWKVYERLEKETDANLLLRTPQEAEALLKEALPHMRDVKLMMRAGEGYARQARDGILDLGAAATPSPNSSSASKFVNAEMKPLNEVYGVSEHHPIGTSSQKEFQRYAAKLNAIQQAGDHPVYNGSYRENAQATLNAPVPATPGTL